LPWKALSPMQQRAFIDEYLRGCPTANAAFLVLVLGLGLGLALLRDCWLASSTIASPSPSTSAETAIGHPPKQQDSVSELCRRFAVSRETTYKWIRRFLTG